MYFVFCWFRACLCIPLGFRVCLGVGLVVWVLIGSLICGTVGTYAG